MSDYDILFHGEDYANRKAAFNADIQAIQEKHIEFFKSRKSIFPSDEHDQLVRHIEMSYANKVAEFWFYDKSDLPEEIRQECIEAFERHFSPNQG